MICRDLIVCLQDTANYFVPKQPSECLMHLPCGCPKPGQELRCEDCPHLEVFMSRCKTHKTSTKQLKFHGNQNKGKK